MKKIRLQFKSLAKKDLLIIVLSCLLILVFALSFYQVHVLQQQISTMSEKSSTLQNQVTITTKQLNALKNVDQYKRNQKLQTEILNINTLYSKSSSAYENIVDLSDQKVDTSDLKKSYATIVNLLANRNYASASSSLSALNSQISTQQAKLAAAQAPVQTSTANVPTSNSLSGSGLNRQKVHTDAGDFVVAIISADLNSTRVIVDTASSSDCADTCPTLPLSDYVSRNGAFAGINGSYFCPADYPSCAGKTGSFDTLLMNKNKVYFNSSNNVYSTVPVVIFSGSGARFTTSENWGRDTSPDAVIAMQPALVLNGSVVYGGGGGKDLNYGPRDFIGVNGSTVYIGTIFNATMSDSAQVIHALGIQNAINLDEGGSTALMYNGSYLAGPGRNIPNAVLLVRR